MLVSELIHIISIVESTCILCVYSLCDFINSFIVILNTIVFIRDVDRYSFLFPVNDGGFFMPFVRKTWVCDNCRHSWKDK